MPTDLFIPNAAPLLLPPTVPPRIPPLEKATVRPDQEYVAGGSTPFIASYFNSLRSLPHYIDDVTQDFGADLYQRMMFDPQVASSINAIKNQVLADDYRLAPAIDDKKDQRYAEAAMICKFWESALSNLTSPFEMFMNEMLDAIALGNKVAEQTSHFDSWNGKQALILNALKVKPRNSFAFVVDPFMNISCLIGLIPGQSWSVLTNQNYIGNVHDIENRLPREKFAIFSFNPKDGDPRGSSLCRAAYTPWSMKMQTLGNFLKYLVQFGGPALVGKLAEGAQPVTDANGNVTLPADAMVSILKALHSGAVAAIPFGAEVTPLNMSGQGGAFLNGFAYFDQQISKAITSQTLATNEGEHQARAASETHSDVMDYGTKLAKRQLLAMVTQDIFEVGTRANFGEVAARELCPKILMGKEDKEDFASLAPGIGSLVSVGFVAPDQYPALDERLGLPTRKAVAPAAQPQPATGQPQLPLGSPQAGQPQQVPGKAGFSVPLPVLTPARFDTITAADIERGRRFLADGYRRPRE